MEKNIKDTHQHKWGYSDTEFQIEGKDISLSGSRYLICGYSMPNFMNFIKDELEIEDLSFTNLQEEKEYRISKSQINDRFMRDIEDIEQTLDDDQRLIHSHGQTSASEIYNVIYGEGELTREVDLVIYPKDDEDIEKILRSAFDNDVCLVPYGGGTNVSCALSIPKEEERMVVSIDTCKMNQMISIDKENNLATFGAGIRGKELEDILNKEGYTCGHEPDSIEFSTLGGWISTNASGMKRSKYGNIEDIVVNYKMHTTKGVIRKNMNTPRNSHGSGIESLIFGSEGNYGLISQATIKINKCPEFTEYQSIVFKNFDQGVAFMKDLTINNSDIIPSSIRLVDNRQFRFALALKPEKTTSESVKENIKNFILENYYGFNPDEMVLCTITYEGKKEEIQYKQKMLQKLANKYEGLLGGSDNGKKGYQLTFAIAYIRDFLSKFYIIGETFETSVPWSNIRDVCKDVELKLYEKTKNYSSKPFLSYRVTQTYKTGVCIYFMLGFYHKNMDNVTKIFSELEEELRSSIIEAGGSISHHHGIGKHRSKFIVESYKDNPELSCIKEFKDNIDPKNIFGISNNIFNHKVINRIAEDYQNYSLNSENSIDCEDSDGSVELGDLMIKEDNKEEENISNLLSEDEKIIDNELEM
jgi:alkyldihydroxyacetonephosphate synthase